MTQSDPAGLTGSAHHMCFVHVDGHPVLAVARNQGVELVDSDDGRLLGVVDTEHTVSALIPLPTAEPGRDLLLARWSGRIAALLRPEHRSDRAATEPGPVRGGGP